MNLKTVLERVAMGLGIAVGSIAAAGLAMIPIIYIGGKIVTTPSVEQERFREEYNKARNTKRELLSQIYSIADRRGNNNGVSDEKELSDLLPDFMNFYGIVDSSLSDDPKLRLQKMAEQLSKESLQQYVKNSKF